MSNNNYEEYEEYEEYEYYEEEYEEDSDNEGWFYDDDSSSMTEPETETVVKRTVPPRDYLPPSRQEMRAVADRLELKSFSPALVRDIANVAAGGDVLPSSKIRQQIESGVRQDPRLTRESDGDWKFAGEWLKDDRGNYCRDRSTAIAAATKRQVKYHQNVADFIESVDPPSLPGDTPLEKAIGLLKLLSTQEGGSSSSSGEEDSLPIFMDGEPEETASKLKEAIDSAESMDEAEEELLNPDEGSTLDVAEDLLKGKEEILKISRQLEKLTKFQVNKTNKVEVDPEGTQIRYRPIRDLSEMDRMHPGEYVYPKAYRNYRMVTGQSPIREKVTRIEKKQYLSLLIDCSGSMDDGTRFYKAGGVLMNRLKAVISGDAELIVYFFDDRIRKSFAVSTKEEAIEVMRQIKSSNFSGGSTEIASCVQKAVKSIHEKLESDPSLCKPELVVVTDGDDDTKSLQKENLDGIRLHAFLVGGRNAHLTDLARRSGGVGIDSL